MFVLILSFDSIETEILESVMTCLVEEEGEDGGW